MSDVTKWAILFVSFNIGITIGIIIGKFNNFFVDGMDIESPALKLIMKLVMTAFWAVLVVKSIEEIIMKIGI